VPARSLVIPGVRAPVRLFPRLPGLPVLPVLALCAALALGCQESGFDEAKETARPLKVQHVLGESKVPGQAEAPAALSLETLDDTLALRVRPVAARIPDGELPSYLRGPAGDVALLGADELPPADADVILASAPQSQAAFDELRAVAPTVVIDEGGAQWKLNLRLVGEGLGKTNDAEALLNAYDEQLARVRAWLPRDARVAGRYPDGSFAAALLGDAGVELVAPGQSAPTLKSSAWSSPGGALAARAALADLRQTLGP
jgi:ABC-type Fe3+-hydroxamate transport system substrate-binding protein